MKSGCKIRYVIQKFFRYLNTGRSESIPWVLITVMLISACTEDPNESEEIATKDMSAEIHVTDNQSQIINVEALLRDGPVDSGDTIRLSGGDLLYASLIGDPAVLDIDGSHFDEMDYLTNNIKPLSTVITDDSLLFLPLYSSRYFTQFEIDGANREILVIFDRPDRLDARHSKVTLPETFKIIAPVSSDVLSRSEEVGVSWEVTGSSDQMIINALSVCEFGEAFEWVSPVIEYSQGSFTIPLDAFIGLTGDCTVNIRADRRALGTIDTAFGRGGIMVGHQIRSVTLMTVP